MTVERMFELITDCLVFICLSCLGLVSVLVFPACLLVVPVHVRKRRGRVRPATIAQFFFDCLRLPCKNPSIVIQFAAASSPYDDAPIHATSSHPTARRVEQRRRGSAGEVVPVGAS